MRASAPSRAALVLVAAVGVGYSLLWLRFTLDDPWISLRFAQSWVRGDGPVFNAGERVEGYSNPLWTAVGAGLLHLGLPALLGLKLVGAALAGGTVLGRTLLSLGVDRWLVAAAALAVALSSWSAVWAVGGLETPVVAFGLVLAWSAALRGRWAVVALGLLLVSTNRFEGVAYAAVAFGLLPAAALAGAAGTAAARGGAVRPRPVGADGRAVGLLRRPAAQHLPREGGGDALLRLQEGAGYLLSAASSLAFAGPGAGYPGLACRHRRRRAHRRPRRQPAPVAHPPAPSGRTEGSRGAAGGVVGPARRVGRRLRRR